VPCRFLLFDFFAWASYSDSNLLCVRQFSCIYMYICIYIYIYIPRYIHRYTHRYIHMYIHMSLCAYERERHARGVGMYIHVCVRERKRKRNREMRDVSFPYFPLNASATRVTFVYYTFLFHLVFNFPFFLHDAL